MDRSTLRIGGALLAALGVFAALGAFLHPPQPATLEAFADTEQGAWRLSHVAIGLAGVLLVIGGLFLARCFTDTAGEGWAIPGAGALILSGIGMFVVGAVETTGFEMLLGQLETAGAGAEHAFLGLSATIVALATAGFMLMAAGVLAFGIAMSRVDAWPAWAAWSGVAVGALSLLIDLAGIPLPEALASVPFYLIAAWFVAAGVLLFRQGRPQPAAPQAEIPAHQPAPPTSDSNFGDY